MFPIKPFPRDAIKDSNFKKRKQQYSFNKPEKMKRTYLLLAAITFLAGMTLLNSCKKEKNDPTDTATLNQEQASDAEDVSASSDAVDDDVDNVMSLSSLKSSETQALPCNVSIDSSQLANKKVTLTFNGDNCAGTRTRTGKIVVSLTNGTKWSDAGAVITVTYTDLKIVRKATGRYIILNGTKTHTNVSGGLVKNLGSNGTPTTIVRKIASDNMSITFTNGAQRTWHVARTRTFTKVNGSLVISISGFGEADGKSNLVEWGTNRRGNDFYTQITTPILMSQDCDYQPSAGVKVHYVGLRTVTTTLGTDSNGVPVVSGCADYYSITWVGVDGTKTVILPY